MSSILGCCLLFVIACGPGEPPPGEPAAAGIAATTGEPEATGGLRPTLIFNARIHTFDADGTTFDDGAMAFSGDGEILAIGDTGAMRAAFPAAHAVDLGGRAVLPGLIDAHGHLRGLAESLIRADLVGAGSLDDVMDRLRSFARGLREGEWLLGRGWDQNDWPEPVFPDRTVLDAAFPDRPVWLIRIDGHAGWANSAALAQADRDLTGDWQPEGGRIHRNADGDPTGILIDGAMELVDRAVPPTGRPRLLDALERAGALLTSLGLTGVHDPGVDRETFELYGSMAADGRLPLRIYAMADGEGPTLQWLCESGHQQRASGRVQMRSVKLYADGALGSRGAALLADYADDPGNRGLLFFDGDALEARLDRAFECGLQVGVHAIGDRANRQVLDLYRNVLHRHPANPGRHRIEHAQILAPSDRPRLAELGIVAAMQPIHATSDMYWAEERLGGQRLSGAYAWRSLSDTGARLAFGSDFPVERANPMLGVYAAVTRQDLDGWPAGGWQAQERLGRAEAIRGFTLDAAYAAFMENEVGSLEAGKRADFVVLDRDPMTVPTVQLPEIRVLQTWLDGRRVHPRD